MFCMRSLLLVECVTMYVKCTPIIHIAVPHTAETLLSDLVRGARLFARLCKSCENRKR